MALIVKENISANDVINCIASCHESVVKETLIFDVYRGEGVDDGYKSIALGLMLQDASQTLTEDQIDAIFNRVLTKLNNDINARLRN